MDTGLTLDEKNFSLAIQSLCEADPLLRAVVDGHGQPPLWAREPGFPTLVQIILEQQVSLASAKACFDKLKSALPVLTPDNFLTLKDEHLLQIGFSRQKSRYSRILAQAIVDGELDIDGLSTMPDDEVFARLTALTGIGPWTANIYLLMALSRPDIWPQGDLALEVALKDMLNLEERPKGEVFQQVGEGWRPYRAVAARILWHYYLSRK